MQAAIFFISIILLFGAGYLWLLKISRKRLSKEKLIISLHKKRSTFLRNKLLQLFEIEKKHQHTLKVLENEVEQLQQDIALKHSANRM